jgi:hypothetical protein
MSNSQLLEAVRNAQATRNDLIQVISLENPASVICGTFVRVLLEVEPNRETYVVARVEGVEEGDQYTGYSQLPNQATTLHLRLKLPPATAASSGASGNIYQLNSISNSLISADELSRWLEAMGGQVPSIASLQAVTTTLRQVVVARVSRQQRPAAPTLNQTQNPSSKQAEVEAYTKIQRASGSPSSAQRSAVQAEALAPSIDEHLTQKILREWREKYTLFPRDCHNLTLSELRTAERDGYDYLQQLRDCIRDAQTPCVVCQHNPPTVVTLPCRHRVMCKGCAMNSKVTCCPMCRKHFVELFEPIEC